MASSAVMAAFLTLVETNWAYTWTPPEGGDALPVGIVAPNLGAEVPDEGTPYLELQYPIATETQITVGQPGNNVYREEGACRFVMMVPSKAGLDPFGSWIDALRNAVRARIFAGVETFAAPPPVLDDRNARGSFFKLSFSVPFRYDILR